jgi:hypothetical protein
MLSQKSNPVQSNPLLKILKKEAWHQLLYLSVWLGGIADVVLIVINWDKLTQIRDRYFISAPPPVASDPLYTYLLPTSWDCSLTRDQVSAISCSLCQPRQITVMPGSPSRLRPRKPPNWAIQRTA